jgi:hypothetical protein
MDPVGDDVSVALPHALLAELQAEAEREHRPAADLVRDIVETALRKRRWRADAEREHRRGQELGLPDEDLSPTGAYRQTIRDKVAQGARSLREGRVVDGDAFMAAMDAGLQTIEQQKPL